MKLLYAFVLFMQLLCAGSTPFELDLEPKSLPTQTGVVPLDLVLYPTKHRNQ